MKKVQVSSKFVANNRLPVLKLAILPLNGEIEGAEFFREALHAALMDTEMNISEKFVVDGVIKKNGWNTSEKLFAIPPQKLGEALGADALLYGKVTKWNKYYAIIHSTLVAGLELKLVDTRTGELLWRGQRVDREFEGLIKIPTGIIRSIVDPISGIISTIADPIFFVSKKSNLDALASKVAKDITESLRKPYTLKKVDKMDQKIIISSAVEYIKKIEENNATMEINPLKEVLVDGSIPPVELEDIPSLEDDYSSLEAIRPELQETNDVAPMPGDSSVTSQKQSSNDIKSASLKTEKSADKKTKTSKPAKISPDKKNIYTIQVGAFQSRNHAKSLIEKLKRKGYNSFIAMARIGKKMWYKVQVDHFQDKKKAVLYAKKLRKKEKLLYFITKTEAAPPA
jgi:cell division septation protein DedD